MVLLIIALLLFESFLGAQGEIQCEEESAGEIHFSVNSVRSSTGHRAVKVNLLSRYSSTEEENSTGLDVHQTWGRCGSSQYMRLETSATSSMVMGSNPVGYEHFPGVGNYKLYTNPYKNWADAQQECQSNSGNLIVIDSEAEAGVIRNLYSRNISRLMNLGAWIGIHDQFKPGYYITVFGDPLSKMGYDKWNNGQPVSSKHCGYTYKDGLLHTWQCEDTLPFVCEL